METEFLGLFEEEQENQTLHFIFTSCFFKIYFSEGKSLKDDDVLQNLPVGTTATMYFRDLGPQIGWTMVRACDIQYYGLKLQSPIGLLWTLTFDKSLFFQVSSSSFMFI